MQDTRQGNAEACEPARPSGDTHCRLRRPDATVASVASYLSLRPLRPIPVQPLTAARPRAATGLLDYVNSRAADAATAKLRRPATPFTFGARSR
jgi:hypothetical protein